MSGRFHAQRIIGVTLSRAEADAYEDAFVSDEEDIAVAHVDPATDAYGHDYATIEGLRERKGDRVRRIQRVKISDLGAGNVETLNRVYEPTTDKATLRKWKKKGQGDLYELPVRSNWVVKWLPFTSYLCRVEMKDIGIPGVFALNPESRRAALERRNEENEKYQAGKQASNSKRKSAATRSKGDEERREQKGKKPKGGARKA